MFDPSYPPRYSQAFLSQPAARQHRWAALVVSLGILLTAMGAIFVASTTAPVLTAFLPMVVLSLVLTHGFTSLLLGLQASQLQHPTLALLAGGYAFMSLLELCQLFSLPGALSVSGISGNGQDASWFGVIANLGFPILALLAVFQLQRKRSVLTLRTALFGPVVLAAAAATVLWGLDDNTLPPLVVGNRHTSTVTEIIAPAQMGLYAVCLLALMLGTHFRTRLHLWLAVALLATLAGVATGISAGERFTVGWYVGRALTLASSAVLLGALLWDIHEMYARLHRVNAELHEDASRDGLTGLFQRRHLDRFLAHFHGETPREAIAIILLDVDHFKLYNDGFGHPMGDACLMAVAHEVASSIRERDGFAARYGGEEIAVVLSGAAVSQAPKIAEHVRARVEALHLQHAPAARQPWITVSCGWAKAQEGWSPNSLIEEADSALYTAKRNGRNQVQGPLDPDDEDTWTVSTPVDPVAPEQSGPPAGRLPHGGRRSQP